MSSPTSQRRKQTNRGYPTAPQNSAICLTFWAKLSGMWPPMSRDCKNILCSGRCREVSGGGIGWGIREEPAGNSFITGAQWGLELDFSPAKSCPELPASCWECPKPGKQGGPPEVAILRSAHLGEKRKREKKSEGGRGYKGERERRRETQTRIFRRVYTLLCTQSQIHIH